MRRLALVVLLTIAAAACGNAGDGETTTTAPVGEGDYQVVMESFAFTPAELTVPVGATVTWTNHHGARHDVVADDGSFASPLFGTGETFSFTFTEPGTHHYVCSIHPGMEGTVIVVPAEG